MTKAKERQKQLEQVKAYKLMRAKACVRRKKLIRAKACIRRMRRTAAAARAVEREMLMIVQHDLDGELDDELIDESELLYEELCKDSEKMKVTMHQWMFWCLQYKPTAPRPPTAPA